jgi:6-phosphogluconolactonase
MLETYATTAAMGDAAAHAVEACLLEGLRTRGRASLVATGGRSPGPVFDALNSREVDWARVVVTLSDERCVAEDAPESNARGVRERLLAGHRSAAHFLPLWPEPPEAALRALAPFDAVMLGMGEDGHIASLIPGDPGLPAAMDPNSDRLLVPVPAGIGKPPLARVSLTLAALLQSRALFLLIAGDAKREVVARAEAGADLPVRAILGQDRVPVRIFWAPSHEG